MGCRFTAQPRAQTRFRELSSVEQIVWGGIRFMDESRLAQIVWRRVAVRQSAHDCSLTTLLVSRAIIARLAGFGILRVAHSDIRDCGRRAPRAAEQRLAKSVCVIEWARRYSPSGVVNEGLRMAELYVNG
jgi:hypothetical protein